MGRVGGIQHCFVDLTQSRRALGYEPYERGLAV